MGASIYFRPTSDKRLIKDVGSPSSFIEAMTAAFGEPPWRLSGSDISKLQGMAAVCGTTPFNNDKSNPFSELAERVDTHDEIEVWPEW